MSLYFKGLTRTKIMYVNDEFYLIWVLCTYVWLMYDTKCSIIDTATARRNL